MTKINRDWSWEKHVVFVLLFLLINSPFALALDLPGGGPSTGPGSSSGSAAFSGYTMNATNTTLTSANASWVFLVNMSGNHTITLPDVSTVAGREFWVLVMVNDQIGVTGNLTINATSGNVNRVDSLVVTNTTNTNSGNVSMVSIKAMDSTYGYTVGVIRR